MKEACYYATMFCWTQRCADVLYALKYCYTSMSKCTRARVRVWLFYKHGSENKARVPGLWTVICWCPLHVMHAQYSRMLDSHNISPAVDSWELLPWHAYNFAHPQGEPQGAAECKVGSPPPLAGWTGQKVRVPAASDQTDTIPSTKWKSADKIAHWAFLFTLFAGASMLAS